MMHFVDIRILFEMKFSFLILFFKEILIINLKLTKLELQRCR